MKYCEWFSELCMLSRDLVMVRMNLRRAVDRNNSSFARIDSITRLFVSYLFLLKPLISVYVCMIVWTVGWYRSLNRKWSQDRRWKERREVEERGGGDATPKGKGKPWTQSTNLRRKQKRKESRRRGGIHHTTWIPSFVWISFEQQVCLVCVLVVGVGDSLDGRRKSRKLDRMDWEEISSPIDTTRPEPNSLTIQTKGDYVCNKDQHHIYTIRERKG